jgi:proteic killer suppression protein
MVIRAVVLSARVRKDLRQCPAAIVRKLMAWVGSVQSTGLEAVRKLPGYHDEPLKGEWAGYRSIRLNRAYRAIYSVQKDDVVEFARVDAVNKHEY